MNINNKGGGLVELLLVVSLSSVAVGGLLKAGQQALLTSNMVKTQQVTREFKNSVYHILNNDCTDILHDDNLDQNNHEKINEMRPIFYRSDKSKNIFKGFIETVDIIVSEDSDPDTDIYIFTLYYKYRDRKTKGGEKCTSNENEKAGCYHVSCNIDREGGECNPLDCVFDESSRSILTNPCDPGQFLVRVTGNKENDCLGCTTGETLIGTKLKAGKLEPICLKRDCPVGKVATGIKPDPDNTEKFIIDCQEVACDEGKHSVLEPDEDDSTKMVMKCKKICHGGQILNEEEECYCPNENNPDIDIDPNGNCYCTDDTKKINAEGNCVST